MSSVYAHIGLGTVTLARQDPVLHIKSGADTPGGWQRRNVNHALKRFHQDLERLGFRWAALVDPAGMFVDTSLPPSPGPLIELLKNGDPAHKVDLLILGDGYTSAERPKLERDARRLLAVLFEYSPFKERRADFNVWGLCPPSRESGISRPSTGIHRRSPVGTTYDAFGSERYILTFDNRSLRDIASYAPYELVEIVVNDATYGGGGIFNLYATVAADSLWAPYIFVHTAAASGGPVILVVSARSRTRASSSGDMFEWEAPASISPTWAEPITSGEQSSSQPGAQPPVACVRLAPGAERV